jgi:hypothetical protein
MLVICNKRDPDLHEKAGFKGTNSSIHSREESFASRSSSSASAVVELSGCVEASPHGQPLWCRQTTGGPSGSKMRQDLRLSSGSVVQTCSSQTGAQGWAAASSTQLSQQRG